MVNVIIDIIHFIVSFILVTISIRSYLKTRLPAMMYLVLGFILISFGHLFADIYFYDDVYINTVLAEIFDILGLIALIIAVKNV